MRKKNFFFLARVTLDDDRMAYVKPFPKNLKIFKSSFLKTIKDLLLNLVSVKFKISFSLKMF